MHLSVELPLVLLVARQGHSLALGACPNSMLQDHLSEIISGLIGVSVITDRDEKMAEARRDAVKALAK